MFTKQCGFAATSAIRRLILAAAVAALVSRVAGAADDGESKTLLKNAYQQQTFVSCAQGQIECVLTFPPTTDTKTVITAVSCSVDVTQGSFVGFTLLSNAAGASASLGFFLPAFAYGQNQAGLLAATNATTNLFVDKGVSPEVQVFVSNGGVFSSESFLSCIISGSHS
jgi:hypothetical protein